MKKTYLVVALLSLTLIGLETIWTRIFSAEFFYTFAFLTLSLAILGMGLGALSIRLFKFLNKPAAAAIMLNLSALLAIAGPPLVMQMGIDFSQIFHSSLEIGKFVGMIVLLSLPFFTAGISLSYLFKMNHRDMPRLYMADLLGAGAGVVLSIFLMNIFGTQSAAFYICIPLLFAGFLMCQKWGRILPALILLGLVYTSLDAEKLLSMERKEHGEVLYTHWDAASKIKIFDFGPEARGLNIDNVANSPVYHFDGNWDRPDSMLYEFGINVKYLMDLNPNCTFLSLGAGGGSDVLQALQWGAKDIHAVEVLPHINWLMTDGDLAEFSGYIYRDPHVKVVTEDARSYVRRYQNKFDLIYSLSSNTFAALASGSFALAENYLFTKEAFRDYYFALSDNGFLMMEHQFYMPRMVTEVIDALTELGVQNPTDHFAIYNRPQMRRKILLMSKKPLTEEIRQNALGELTPEKFSDIHLLYPAADSLKDNLINRIVQNGWKNVQDSALVDISPCTDNRPFTAQMGMWKNFDWKNLEKIRPYEFFGFPLSKIIISIILLIIFILVLPINLLPYLTKGEKLKPGPWLYFVLIGMGFMIVEIVLMQRYTLFIGPSSYSFITILMTLLLASGIGSRFADRFNNVIPFYGILLWLILEIVAFRPLTYALGGLEMPARIMLSALFIAPLGFFMGMPFPKAAKRVGELIDWGFAVNGAASVLGSTMIVVVAINYGFDMALICGMLCYFLAMVIMRSEKSW